MRVYAVDNFYVPPIEMPDRFGVDVAYFMTPADEPGVPPLGAREYWVKLDDARCWLDEMVVEVMSPLDMSVQAEVELTEEQEAWLEWMVANQVQHIRLGEPD